MHLPSILRRTLLVSGLALWSAFGATTGCSDPANDSQTQAGTLRVPLVTETGGVVYRLTGQFTITGPQTLIIDTADDPNALVRSADLPIGIYSVVLDSGFVVEREVEGTFEPIDADLVTPNPRSFVITSQTTTNVTFGFAVEGQVIEFDEGTLNLDIAVEDRSNGPVALTAGSERTCARMANGAVRCWGLGVSGQLGYGNTDNIGDNETPASAGDVPLGAAAVRVAAGSFHTCAVLDFGAVRCWGANTFGELGYGNTDNIGDDETPASAGNVVVGGAVVDVAPGLDHTCALLETGAVRCWGWGYYGELGYGNTDTIGDDETPASAGDVNVGGTVVQISAGSTHTCAVLDTGAVRCWGSSSYGELGYGNTDTIGDNEAPASAGDVDVGGTVVKISAGNHRTCALLDTGTVRCWGWGLFGALGYGNTNNIGDDESPASAGDVPVGGTVVQMFGGDNHTCVLLDTGAVRCWGSGNAGQLGYGNTEYIGDDESPASAGDVNLGAAAVSLAAGLTHTCAVLITGAVRCWGSGSYGELGYGNTDNIGDDETPASAGDVDVGFSTQDPAL